MPSLRILLPLALLLACTGQPAAEPTAESTQAESTDKRSDDAELAKRIRELERSVRGDKKPTIDPDRMIPISPPPSSGTRPGDDGWRAPASIADPAACRGAPPPEPHDPRALEPAPLPAGANPALTNASLATETAPETYKVRFETSAGPFVIEVNRDWAPIGADRFYNMVKIGYFDGASFFRNVAGFMVQFGISPYPEVNEAWRNARIKDEPVKVGNRRGIVTFAKCGAPDCRSTQVFINHSDNPQLDGMGFSGFGRVVEGMDVVDKLYSCYGEGAPGGRGPRQDLIQKLGKSYLDAGWPKLDRVERATIVD